MLLYMGVVSGWVHLVLSQTGVLQGLAWAGDHPGRPLSDGETETAWTQSVLSVGRFKPWLQGGLPACPFFVPSL